MKTVRKHDTVGSTTDALTSVMPTSTESDSVDMLPVSKPNPSSPAFSFYAKDWLSATITWALDARGAYVTLLAYQWDSGSIPGDDLPALARLLGVSKVSARALWFVISGKFDRGPDGLWRNARLEQERQKQADRRAALKDNGLKGGRPPKNLKDNQKETNRLSTEKPNENLNKSLSSSSAFSESSTTTTGAKGYGRGANETNALPMDHAPHAICGPRWVFCITYAQYDKLARRYNGTCAEESKQALTEFVGYIEALITEGKSTGDFLWVIRQYDVWLASKGRIPEIPKVTPKRDDSALLAKLEAVEAKAVRR